MAESGVMAAMRNAVRIPRELDFEPLVWLIVAAGLPAQGSSTIFTETRLPSETASVEPRWTIGVPRVISRWNNRHYSWEYEE